MSRAVTRHWPLIGCHPSRRVTATQDVPLSPNELNPGPDYLHTYFLSYRHRQRYVLELEMALYFIWLIFDRIFLSS